MVSNMFVFLQEMTHMEVVNGELPDAEKLSKMMAWFHFNCTCASYTVAGLYCIW